MNLLINLLLKVIEEMTKGKKFLSILIIKLVAQVPSRNVLKYQNAKGVV